jgi:hypothetical protein
MFGTASPLRSLIEIAPRLRTSPIQSTWEIPTTTRGSPSDSPVQQFRGLCSKRPLGDNTPTCQSQIFFSPVMRITDRTGAGRSPGFSGLARIKHLYFWPLLTHGRGSTPHMIQRRRRDLGPRLRSSKPMQPGRASSEPQRNS